MYLEDLNILDFVGDSTEMVEIIKLAKQYKLEALFKACETHFKEIMVQSFDCSNLISLKQTNVIPNSTSNFGKRKTNKEENKDRTAGRSVQQVS